MHTKSERHILELVKVCMSRVYFNAVNMHVRVSVRVCSCMCIVQGYHVY